MSSYGEEESPELEELLHGGARADVKQLMSQMDQELQNSTLADSFVRATNATRKEVRSSWCE